MVRKIVEQVPEEQLQEDLEKYRQRALELGATDAKVITTDMVIVDERVLAKCVYPKCPFYGTNANCPPHAIPPEQIQRIVNNFQYAIFIYFEVPPDEITGPKSIEKEVAIRWRKKIYETVSRIEAEAYYDGYHLALGFAGGSCQRTFCPGSDCAVLAGQSCKSPLKARAAMEAVGMDAFIMATKAGWDAYPVGVSSQPAEIPHGTRLGLVLIY